MGKKINPWPSEADSILHIYSQNEWHDEVHILGTASAIKTLRDACDRALPNGYAETGNEEDCVFVKVLLFHTQIHLPLAKDKEDQNGPNETYYSIKGK